MARGVAPLQERLLEEGGENDEERASDQGKVAGDVGLLSCLRFFRTWEVAVYMLGLVFAAAFGSVLPVQSIVIGKIFTGGAGVDGSALHDNIIEHIPDLLKLGVVALGSGYLQHVCLMSVAERVVERIRVASLKSLLQQEVGYFDAESPGKLSTILGDQSQVLLRGLAESIGLVCVYFSQFITGFVIAFTMSWKVAVAMLVVIPVNAGALGLMIMLIMRNVAKINENNENMGSFAEDILSSMSTVASIRAENRAIEYYDKFLGIYEKYSRRTTLCRVFGVGSVFCLIFVSYGLGYWWGSHVIASMEGAFGDVLSAVFSCVLGSIAIGVAMPNVQALTEARLAAKALFAIIDREPQLQVVSNPARGALQHSVGQGAIEFRDVAFRYPGRSQQILGNVSFSVTPGTTTALVGPSGTGKSTCIALLERFYDPSGGRVLVDGVDIHEYSLEGLRSNIALVSQEPILFAADIKTNICMGLPQGQAADYVGAAKQANAHTFILNFPDGYETQCGARGTQLSGGQKQRIAIARALIRKPKILLLDEATAALDNVSELSVQNAIDELLRTQKLTSIVIAHRLSSIQNSDKIVVFGENPDQSVGGSVVVEQGTHAELLALGKSYKALVDAAKRTDADKGGQTRPPAAETDDASGSGFLSWFSSRKQIERKNSSVLSHVSDGFSSIPFAKMSVGSEAPDFDQGPEDIDGQLYHVPASRVWELNRPEYWYFVVGSLGAAVKGTAQPLMSLVLSHLLVHLVVIPLPLLDKPCDPNVPASDFPCGKDHPEETCFDFGSLSGKGSTGFCFREFWPGYSPDDVRAAGLHALILYIGIGCLVGLGLGVSIWCFMYAGNKLTRRLRLGVFSSLCRQDAAFFDMPENNIGALLSRLSNDAMLVQNATGDYLMLVVENVVALIVAAAIAFSASWQMSRVVFIPCGLLVWSSFNDQKRMVQFAKAKLLDKRCEQVINQSLNSVRTVYSCTAQAEIIDMFAQTLGSGVSAGIKAAHIMGLQTGLSQAMYQIIYSFAFWYGAQLVAKDEIDPQSLSRVFFVLTISATFIGQSIARGNDTSKASIAISKLFEIMDRKSPIDYTDPGGLVQSPQSPDGKIDGSIKFSNVSFTYPTRPNQQILNRFAVEIKAGQTVAFVGESGSGKSTIIKLIERFYNPTDDSEITVDGTDIRRYNLYFLRSQIGLCAQEPVLFNGSIMENIMFGSEGLIDEEKVIEACKAANAHDFILAFPDGYSTQCGANGKALSGGQKQRIGIARAILHDPSILLLDESTSALDNQSEKIVQAALDDLMAKRKRTTIVVAHRLSTIQNADMIVVLDKGKIVESGTHDELMKIQNGKYVALQSTQSH